MVCVSVIIPCKDAQGVLPLQLEALSRQVGAPSYEVVIADNGDYNYDRLLTGWEDAAWSQIRIADASGRRGVGWARNVGAMSAAASLLLFCDADDVVSPHFVARGVKALAASPVFSGAALGVAAADFGGGYRYVLDKLGVDDPALLPYPLSGTDAYPILMGGAFGIHASVYEEVGGFDLSFGNAAEDNDLAFRLVRSGYPICDAVDVRVAYRQRPVGKASFIQGFRTGRGFMMLSARHGLWSGPGKRWARWPIELGKALATCYRLLLGETQREAWLRRMGTALGAAVGHFKYRFPGKPPRPDFG